MLHKPLGDRTGFWLKEQVPLKKMQLAALLLKQSGPPLSCQPLALAQMPTVLPAEPPGHLLGRTLGHLPQADLSSDLKDTACLFGLRLLA